MNNKRMIGLTVAIIAGMIIIPTIYKIHENHNEKLLQVVENEFHYYAKECYLNDECTSTNLRILLIKNIMMKNLVLI